MNNVTGISRTRRLAIGGIALILGATAGCSKQSQGLDASSNEQIAAGLTDSLQRRQDDWSLQRVQQELIRRCMQKSKLLYYVTSAGPYPTQTLLTDDTFTGVTPQGYGLYLHEIAQHVGVPDGQQATSKQDAYQRSLPAAQQAQYTKAFFGSDSSRQSLRLPGGGEVSFPAEGCLAEALTQIYGNVKKQAELEAIPQIVRAQMNAKIGSDTAYRSAADAWRTCMQARGFNYKSPSDAINQLQSDYARAASPEQVLPKERNVAQADASCDAKTQLRLLQKQARVRALAGIGADLERQTLALLQLRDDAVSRAKSLLAASGSAVSVP